MSQTQPFKPAMGESGAAGSEARLSEWDVSGGLVSLGLTMHESEKPFLMFMLQQVKISSTWGVHFFLKHLELPDSSENQ